MVKGVLHLHSRHSDGELTIAELRSMYLAAGCRFACITDHADAFDADRLEAYVRDCEAASDASFLFIPGLEFSCRDRMHILGYGVTALIPSADPEDVIAHIQRESGLAVIAHPKDAAFGVIEAFQHLPDGIEVWNSKYDGRFAPRSGTFALAGRLRARRPSLCAFYGQDLHWRRQFNRLFTDVDLEDVSRASVLAALSRGAFVGVKDQWRLPSDATLPPALADHFERVHDRSHRVRRWATIANGWLKRSGLTGLLLPNPVKTQLRRLF